MNGNTGDARVAPTRRISHIGRAAMPRRATQASPLHRRARMRAPPRAWLGVGLCLIGTLGTACSTHNVRGNMLELMRDTVPSAPPPTLTSRQPVTVDDVEYRAVNSGLHSRWPPVEVQVSVKIKNVGSHARRLELLGGNCAVRVRIYSADDIAHAKAHPERVHPVFDATQPSYECYVPQLRLGLAAGADTTLRSAGDGPGVQLPPGRYDLVGIVTVIPSADSLRRHGVVLVEVPAGSIRVAPPYD